MWNHEVSNIVRGCNECPCRRIIRVSLYLYSLDLNLSSTEPLQQYVPVYYTELLPMPACCYGISPHCIASHSATAISGIHLVSSASTYVYYLFASTRSTTAMLDCIF